MTADLLRAWPYTQTLAITIRYAARCVDSTNNIQASSILLAWWWRGGVRQGVEAADFDAEVYTLRREPHLTRRIERIQIQDTKAVDELPAE